MDELHSKPVGCEWLMKHLGILSFFIIGLPLLVMGGFWLVMGPWHEWQGRQNTQYSEKFSWERFGQVTNGMILADVTNLLGATLGDKTDSAYPGWAVHDLSGKVYASNSTIRIEWLYFSLPKNSWNDYEWVQVVLGPEGTVIDKNHYVTD